MEAVFGANIADSKYDVVPANWEEHKKEHLQGKTVARHILSFDVG